MHNFNQYNSCFSVRHLFLRDNGNFAKRCALLFLVPVKVFRLSVVLIFDISLFELNVLCFSHQQ